MLILLFASIVFVSVFWHCSALILHSATAKVQKRDDTQLTDYLNAELETGLVVRVLDYGANAGYVPATFWSNEIITPNQLFLINQTDVEVTHQFSLNHGTPIMGYIANGAKLQASKLWGEYGPTMYGHDANSCDGETELGVDGYGRCTWLPSIGLNDSEHQYWECPGGFFADIDAMGEPYTRDVSKQGAGNYGCRGCHLHQLKAKGLGTVETNCQCPCNDYDSCYRFAMEDLRGSITDDQSVCWVENTHALAGIQNGLYHSRGSISPDFWFGWNEVAVKREIDKPENWLTQMIFVPAWLSKRIQTGAFDDKANKRLEGQIQELFDNGFLRPGKDQIGRTSGSDVVFVEEIQKGSGDEYEKRFFCMQLDVGKFTICSLAYTDDPNQTGHCYIADAVTGCT